MERQQSTSSGQEPDQALWSPEGAERPQLLIRAAHGADEELLERMFFRLSPRTLYLRFLLPIPVTAHQAFRVTKLARVESSTSYAVVACEGEEIRGIARYDPEPAPATVELSVLIEDAWQGCGLGKALASQMIVEALRRGITQFTANIQGENVPALRLVKALFREAHFVWNGGTWQAHLKAETLHWARGKGETDRHGVG
jgi:GNAT superfamily N-acetyltransferase